jgi:hypothetical protein
MLKPISFKHPGLHRAGKTQWHTSLSMIHVINSTVQSESQSASEHKNLYLHTTAMTARDAERVLIHLFTRQVKREYGKLMRNIES